MSQSPGIPGIYGDLRLFAGSAYLALGQEVADYLEIPLGAREIKRFSNENIFVKLGGSVRGQDVYLIQGMASPVSDNILELLIVLQTLRLDSASRITAVIPHMSYGRSDKKDQPRVPITARLLADMVKIAGADRYIVIDLHAGQIQGFFSIAGDVLTAFHLFKDYFAAKELSNGVIVAPDLGFAKKGRNYAERLNMPLAVIEKRRKDNTDRSEVMSLIGDVAGKDAILIDDECNTGTSMCNAVTTVIKGGARDVYVAFTHAVLSDGAIKNLASLPVKEIVTTNTLPIPPEKRLPNMQVLSVGPLLAEVIRRAHEGRSVGSLFNE
ncbi:MAG TPA: ribose-phosphate pyrophosphokinase [Aggregatilineales bacterium]|nr:ribose-phosphate pyrophosphokinase [Aggregatilineales bacterium]